MAPLFVLHDGVRKENIEPGVHKQFVDVVGGCSVYDIVSYIYGLLHSHVYKELFGERLAIEVPPIPIPNNGRTPDNSVL